MTLLLLSHALAALPDPEHLRDADRDSFHHLHGGGALGPPPPGDPGPPSPWDIVQYVAHVRVDAADETVTGRMTISAVRRPEARGVRSGLPGVEAAVPEGASEARAARDGGMAGSGSKSEPPAGQREPSGDLLFHYTGGPLGTVTVDGVAVVPVATDGVWHVSPAGSETTVVIDWVHTGPSPEYGIRFDPGITWSVDEPDLARTWLPVYDEPWDKALWTWEIEALSGLTVAANGTLVSVDAGAPGSDGRAFDTWTFVFDQPLATYLAVLHVAEYQVFEIGDDVPVTIWANPVLAANIEETFGTTPDMIRFFSDAYGDFPWERYGNAIVPFGGAMENTTCTSFGDIFVGGNAELVNVHELGHHWFGDDVTLADWRDIWLNEGFASYTEALWYERTYGQEGLTEYLDWQRDVYYQWKSSEGDFSLYDPGYLFGGTVYDKGSWVVHMLRGIVGDDAFFHALQQYTERYAFANASTSEFEQSFEDSTGTDLAWFFDGYVNGTGEPTLSFGYQAVEGGVAVAIEADTQMPLPIPLRVVQVDGSVYDTKVTLNSSSICEFLPTDGPVSEVELDPDLWLLTLDRTSLSSTAIDSCVATLQDTGSTDTGAPERPGGDHGGTGCGCDSSGGWMGLWAFSGAVALGRRRRAR